jgi:uncharacterized repeat protein (TIGR03803 family)
VLHSFGSGTDGAGPIYGSSLIKQEDRLYGTTLYGGINGGGTVFEVSISGKERVLYRFEAKPDGANPFAGLIALNGVLYGTAANGGASGYGTVFRISP